MSREFEKYSVCGRTLCAWHSACAISIFMGKILHSLQTEQNFVWYFKVALAAFFSLCLRYAALSCPDTCGTYTYNFRTLHTTTTKTVCHVTYQDYFLNNYFQFFTKTHLNITSNFNIFPCLIVESFECYWKLAKIFLLLLIKN